MARLIIAKVLKAEGLTKYRLALRMRKPPSAIHRYTRPDFNPTFTLLCEIAEAIGVRVRDLIEE